MAFGVAGAVAVAGVGIGAVTANTFKGLPGAGIRMLGRRDAARPREYPDLDLGWRL